MSVTLLVLVRSCLSFLLPQLTASQRWGDEEPSSSEVHLSHREGRRVASAGKNLEASLWSSRASDASLPLSSLGRVLPNSP